MQITVKCYGGFGAMSYASKALKSFLAEAEDNPDMWERHKTRRQLWMVGYFGLDDSGRIAYTDEKASVGIWGTPDHVLVSVTKLDT